MGGRSLGKEQMPHDADGEGLTLCSTLGRKCVLVSAVGIPKHNG